MPESKTTSAAANHRAKRLYSAAQSLRSAANDLNEVGMHRRAQACDETRAYLVDNFKVDATYGGWSALDIASALEEIA